MSSDECLVTNNVSRLSFLAQDIRLKTLGILLYTRRSWMLVLGYYTRLRISCVLAALILGPQISVFLGSLARPSFVIPT